MATLLSSTGPDRMRDELRLKRSEKLWGRTALWVRMMLRGRSCKGR
jgi:hypothetical protein